MAYAALQKLVSPPIKELLTVIQRAGGRGVLVGGCVRDALLGFEPKDIDIEVYGLSSDALKASLKPHFRVFAVGVSFGVLKVYLEDGTELDVSLPRRDSRPGELGDLGIPDPTTTPQAAASRRDFTINAMAFDHTGSDLLDYYGGQADLRDGLLRHVGPAFAHDPLRVLRGMQFAARWNFRLAPETARFCQTLLPLYDGLAKERVWGEWHKLAAKGDWPSAGLRVLEETGWRSLYAPLERLAERSLWDGYRHGVRLGRVARPARRSERRGPHGFRAGKSGPCLRGGGGRAFSDRYRYAAWVGSPDCQSDPRTIDLPAGRVVGAGRASAGLSVAASRVCAVGRIGRSHRPCRCACRLVRISSATWLRDGIVRPLLQGRHLQEAGLQPGQHFKVILEDALQAQLNGSFSTVEEAQAWLARRLAGSE